MKKKWMQKGTLKVVTGVAVVGVAVSALANASALESIFEPKNFERFENRHQADSYDYTEGEGKDSDLADKDQSSDQSSGNDEQQVLQVKEEQAEQKPGNQDGLGLADGTDVSDNSDNRNGFEFSDSDQNNGTGGNGTGENNSATGSGENNENNNGNGGTDNPGNDPVNPGQTIEDWIQDQLKPKDPVTTKDGTLTKLTATFNKDYYTLNEAYEPADATVRATFVKDGQTVEKELDYGTGDGYQVTLSTRSAGTQNAVFQYKGMSARASYLVLSKTVFINYYAYSNGNPYTSDFPGLNLPGLAEGSDKLTDFQKNFGQPYNFATVGSAVNLTLAHSYMIAYLGDASVKEAFQNSDNPTTKSVVFLEEDENGYLKTMLEGFRAVQNSQVMDQKSSLYYILRQDGDSYSPRVADYVVPVDTEKYQIQRITEGEGDMTTYKGEQVLTGYLAGDDTLTVPMGVTSIVLDTPAESVHTLTIPQSVQGVDVDSLVKNLPNLENYVYEDGDTEYGSFKTFDGVLYTQDGTMLVSVPSQKKYVKVPASVKKLAKECFAGLSEDTVIEFEGENAPELVGDTGYHGVIRIPDSKQDTVWKNYMFAFGKECENITFGTSDEDENRYTYVSDESGTYLVYSDGKNTLAGLPTDTVGRYELPEGITCIGKNAFSGCTDLTDIGIPAGNVKISPEVFGNPDAEIAALRFIVADEQYSEYLNAWSKVLDPVYGKGTAERILTKDDGTYIFENGVKYEKLGKNTYRLVKVYQNDVRTLQVKDGTTEISSNAFFNASKLEILYFPDSVKGGALAENALASCTSLESVISENAQLLKNSRYGAPEGAEVFYPGDSFTSYQYEDGVVYGTDKNGKHTLLNVVTDKTGKLTIKENTSVIHQNALKGCSALQSVELASAETLEEIGESGFQDCSSIARLDLKACTNLKSIGRNAFRACRSLSGLSLPGSIDVLSDGMCYDCVALQSVENTALKEIGDETFYNCEQLTTFGEWTNVQKLGDRAFFNCLRLKNLLLPPSLTSIGESCFENCVALETVELNSSLVGISKYCFYGCKSLQSVSFGEEQAKMLKVIGVQAFGGCETLQNLDLSVLTDLTQMGERTFEECRNLLKIQLPEGLAKVPDHCFESCESLSIVQINADVLTQLGEFAFGETMPQYLHIWVKDGKVEEYVAAYKESLDQLYGEGTTQSILEKINDKIEYILGVTFENTEAGKVLVRAPKSLTGSYSIPVDTIRIAEDAFKDCQDLTELILPAEAVTDFGDRCFKGCEGLKKVTLNGSIPNWGEETFMDCTGLEEVYIGSTVSAISRIGTRAFMNCTGLSKSGAVTFRGKIAVWGESCFENCSNLTAYGITVTANGAGGAREALEVIEDAAFRGCTKLTSVITSKYTALKTIGKYAFADCDSLKGPSVPAGVTSLGEGCFMNCDNLTTVSIYGALEEYPKDCFKNCPKLTKTGGTAAAFSGLKRIGESAYEGCVSLVQAGTWTLNKYVNLEEIGAYAFRGCISLGEVTLPDTVKIGTGAFDEAVPETENLILDEVVENAISEDAGIAGMEPQETEQGKENE